MYILNCVFLCGGFPGRDTENVYLSFPFLAFIYAIFFIIIFFNKSCMKKVILKNVPLLILGQSFQVHAGSCYLLTPLVSNSLPSSLGYIYIFFFFNTSSPSPFLRLSHNILSKIATQAPLLMNAHMCYDLFPFISEYLQIHIRYTFPGLFLGIIFILRKF